MTESYDVRWIPTWARVLDVPTNRHKELLEGMRTTLERLAAASEAERRPSEQHGPTGAKAVMTACFTTTPGIDVITTTLVCLT